ncbi:MAG: nuclease [Planctomycetes bacterium]|nr:nuclease [Planctomycetota bacterium]
MSKHFRGNLSAEDKNPIRILVDDREKGSGVLEHLKTVPDVSTTVTHLELGDYQLHSSLLFERKTLRDLAISIIDGRLFSQISRLKRSACRGVLILEGTTSQLEDMDIKRESIQGALIAVTVGFGVPILRSLCPEETARLIVFTERQKHRIASGNFPRGGYRPKGKRKTQLHILQSLPGIGPKRAEKLLETFGAVRDVMTASEKKLNEVDGIGDVTAQGIVSVLKEAEADYKITSGAPSVQRTP